MSVNLLFYLSPLPQSDPARCVVAIAASVGGKDGENTPK